MNRKPKQVFFPFTPLTDYYKGQVVKRFCVKLWLPFQTPQQKSTRWPSVDTKRAEDNTDWEPELRNISRESILSAQRISPDHKSYWEHSWGYWYTSFDTVFLRKEALVRHLGYMSFNNLRKAVMRVYIHVCVVSTSHTVSSLLDVGWGKVRAKTSPIMSARCNCSQVE